MPDRLWTIGYQGRDLEGFLSTLRSAGVRRVVDVRERPYGRRPEFNQKRLEVVLTETGIEYEHRPELGVVKEVRDAYKGGGAWGDFAAWYEQRLHQEGPSVAAVALVAHQEPTALLCLEADATACHRSLLAERIAQTGLGVEHL